MKYTIFGESHGPAIGITLSGVPAGLELDWDAVNFEMARRAPGKNEFSTARKEADEVKVLSGLFEGKTTGAPLCAVIENTDTRSGDYEKTKDLARPGHADYAAYVRYGGHNDYRGGGHFSGRLTAPLVFAGAVAKQILAGRGAVRVHGGGFAGTVQAFVPTELVPEFKEKTEAVLGKDACNVMAIRPVGGIRIG